MPIPTVEDFENLALTLISIPASQVADAAGVMIWLIKLPDAIEQLNATNAAIVADMDYLSGVAADSWGPMGREAQIVIRARDLLLAQQIVLKSCLLQDLETLTSFAEYFWGD